MSKEEDSCCGCGCLVALLVGVALIGGCVRGCMDDDKTSDVPVVNNYYNRENPSSGETSGYDLQAR